MDSTDLLKAEIEKEEALLAKETKQLQEMEKNAKRAEAERKRQLKNVRCVALKPQNSLLTFERNIPYFGSSAFLANRVRMILSSCSLVKVICKLRLMR